MPRLMPKYGEMKNPKSRYLKVWYRGIVVNLFSTFITLCAACLYRAVETKKKAVQRVEEQLMKLEVQATDREENKQIALGTSKLNYLDPRISVAW